MLDPERRQRPRRADAARPGSSATRLKVTASSKPSAGQDVADLGLDPLATAPRGARQRARRGPRGCARSRGSAPPPRSGRSRAPGRSASSAAGTVTRRPAARPASSSPSAVRIRRTVGPVDRDPQDPLDLVEPERDRRPLAAARPPTSITPGWSVPPATSQDQLGAAAAGPLGDLGVERPLEPEARRAEQAQAPATSGGPTSASNCAASIRTFVVSGADLGLEAPHHARQADRAGRRRRSPASRASARRSCC